MIRDCMTEWVEQLKIKRWCDEIQAKWEAEYTLAPKCVMCLSRCDSPYGNGKLCLVCASRPTAEDLAMIVY